MKILVVGATGVLGRQIVRRLLAQGAEVRALTRAPERAADLARQGAEVVAGDLVDKGSLERACSGVDRVLAAAHALLGRGRHRSERVDDAGHRALIDAARAAGVGRFVYISASAAAADHPIDFFRTKFAIEEVLQRSGVAHVILRPTAFMEQHVHEFNGKSVLKTGRAQLIGSGNKQRNFVAAEDVAQFAVHALLSERAPSSPLHIGGPGNYSNTEVAQLYAKLAGTKLRVSHLPPSVARFIAGAVGPFHPGLSRLLKLLALPDDAYSEAFDCTALQRAHPEIQLTTVESFVRARITEAGVRSSV